MIGKWLAGNRSRLPLLVLLALRSRLLERRAATALAILALAAGVALACGVELVTQSVSSAFGRTVEALVGSAQLEVTAGDAGVPEELVERLRHLPGVRSASPMIEHTFRIARGPFANEPIRVVAIDLLYEGEVRDYRLTQGGFTVRDPLRLIATTDAIVVASPLAQRLHLSEGDALELRSAAGESTFHVRGFLSGDLAEAFGGQIAVMDLYALQAQLGREGRVDRIDLALDPGLDVEAMRERVAAEVGPLPMVRPSSLRRTDVDPFLAAMNAGIAVVALMGILLALFMTYAIASLAVDQRTQEFALLRAAGMTGIAVSALVVIDALVLAVPGALLGSLTATRVSDSLVRIFSRASSFLQHSPIELVEVRWATVAMGAAVGLGIALLASLEPAVRAGRRPPLEGLRTHQLREQGGRWRAGVAIAAALLTAAAVGLGDQLPPAVRVTLSVLFGALAVGAGTSQLFVRGFRWIERLLSVALPRIGPLAGAALADRPIETGATIAVWTAGLGGLLALLNMTHSVAVSVDDYRVGLRGPDAVMVSAEDPLASYDREPIRREVIEQIRGVPGVLDMAEQYNAAATWRGRQVTVWSFPTRATMTHAMDLRALSDDPAATLAALLRGELVMSKAFARRFGAKVGDVVELATEQGSHLFRIGGFARSYLGPQAGLFLDVAPFETWRHPAAAPLLWIWTAQPRDEVLQRIHQQVDGQALFFQSGKGFQRLTERMVAKFNDLAMLPVSMIGALGAISLTSLLFASVVARRRDLALIRAAGASTGDLARLVLAHGFAIGAVGTACGLVLGMIWTRVVTDATAHGLDFEVEYHVNAPAAAALIGGALVVSLAAAVVPVLMGRTRVPAGATDLA